MRLVCVLLIAAPCNADELAEARRLAASSDEQTRKAGIAKLVEAGNAKAAAHFLDLLERRAAKVQTAQTRYEKEHQRWAKELDIWAKLTQQVWDKLSGAEPREGLEAVLVKRIAKRSRWGKATATR